MAPDLSLAGLGGPEVVWRVSLTDSADARRKGGPSSRHPPSPEVGNRFLTSRLAGCASRCDAIGVVWRMGVGCTRHPLSGPLADSSPVGTGERPPRWRLGLFGVRAGVGVAHERVPGVAHAGAAGDGDRGAGGGCGGSDAGAGVLRRDVCVLAGVGVAGGGGVMRSWMRR